MRSIWLAVGAIIIILDYVKSDGPQQYSTRYDNLDVDTIISSQRLVSNYVHCLLNKKPCAPEGKDLKRILPDALRTKCARCSPKQKESALKIITKLYQEYPHYYKALCERWDPTGEYNRRFEEYLQDEQFNIVGNNERPSFDYNRDQQPSEQPVLAPVPARTTVRTTTTQRATRPPIIITLPTERPNRSPSVGSNTLNRIPDQNFSPSINTANRFGDEEVQSISQIPDSPSTTTTQRPTTQRPTTQRPTTQRPTTQRPTTQRPVVRTSAPTRRQTSTTKFQPQRPTTNIIDSFFVPPTDNYRPPPIHQFINSIGTKLTSTAELFAGMLRKTVNVFVGVN